MDNATNTEGKNGLVLEFANPHGPGVQLGPFSYLHFEGEKLIAGPAGELIAQHADHRWVLTQGGGFSRIDCNAPVMVQFHSSKDSQTRKLGPFKSFSSVDGVAYADRRVVAFCDRQLKDWYSLDVGSHWKVLMVHSV